MNHTSYYIHLPIKPGGIDLVVTDVGAMSILKV
jgi:hypothetical protein